MATMKQSRGNCYVTCEALYHLLGGKKAGLVPHYLKHEGDTHWYLVMHLGDGGKRILDPTVWQFKKPPNYKKGKGSGFLTKYPSRRARQLMTRMVWQ